MQRQLGCGYGVDNVCNGLYTHPMIWKSVNNANGDCYCDWEKPITLNPTADALLTFPYSLTTFEETQSVNTAFQKESPRW